MKKYAQITLVVIVFSLLVFWRRSQATEDNLGLEPTPPASVAPTVSPSSITSPPPSPVVSTPPSSSPTESIAPSVQPSPIPSPSPQPTPIPKKGLYTDGTYTGSTEDAFYGNVQVQAVITNGQISDVIFLQHPQDNGTSREVNNYAMPLLTSEAIQAQSAKVDVVSGASATSQAFQLSLATALQKAQQ